MTRNMDKTNDVLNDGIKPIKGIHITDVRKRNVGWWSPIAQRDQSDKQVFWRSSD